MNFPEKLAQKLEQRQNNNSLRELTTSKDLVDFSSNDYLGLSKNDFVFKAAHQLIHSIQNKNGSTGSRLITGNNDLHESVEKFLADFFNAKSGLLFNSGYDANIGVFSSIPQRGDIILYDELIHASIRDGIGLSNAKAYKFKHNNISHLKTLIEKNIGTGDIYIATETVFSMDGDTPDLEEFVQLSEKYNAYLILDEAHAVGVFGKQGRGLVSEKKLEDKIFLRIHTFGKAMGCHGAVVLGSEELRAYLINFARSFIYTTAIPMHSVAVIKSAFEFLQKNENSIQELHQNINYFKSHINSNKINFIDSDSAIHCCIISGNDVVKQVAKTMQNSGLDVRPILSPTVPEGQERLRICLHNYNTKKEIDQFFDILTPFFKS